MIQHHGIGDCVIVAAQLPIHLHVTRLNLDVSHIKLYLKSRARC